MYVQTVSLSSRPKIVKSSASKSRRTLQIFRKSTGHRQKAAEYVSVERALRVHDIL
jgi:hypothetical protein